MQKSEPKKKLRPKQKQKRQPGLESTMEPKPVFTDSSYKGSGRLKGKAAIITGGDSGIGRAVAVAFAKEGCDVAIVYYNEHKDARFTKECIENENQRCILISGDIGREAFCISAVKRAYKYFGRLDIVVNNAAVQYPKDSITSITRKQLEKTYKTNIFAMFYIVKASLKYLKENSTIINTTSVTAYRGSGHLIDYASTKGAIVSFTRSLSSSLVKKKIRVNGVAPGQYGHRLSLPAFHQKMFLRLDLMYQWAGQGSRKKLLRVMYFLQAMNRPILRAKYCIQTAAR